MVIQLNSNNKLEDVRFEGKEWEFLEVADLEKARSKNTTMEVVLEVIQTKDMMIQIMEDKVHFFREKNTGYEYFRGIIGGDVGAVTYRGRLDVIADCRGSRLEVGEMGDRESSVYGGILWKNQASLMHIKGMQIGESAQKQGYGSVIWANEIGMLHIENMIVEGAGKESSDSIMSENQINWVWLQRIEMKGIGQYTTLMQKEKHKLLAIDELLIAREHLGKVQLVKGCEIEKVVIRKSNLNEEEIKALLVNSDIRELVLLQN